MTVREVLQTELWSKRTSRKILIGFGIVVAVLAVALGIERYWLTPSERNAGRSALAAIDGLQHAEDMSHEVFHARDLMAKNQVDVASRAAWTGRDKVVVLLLENYLVLTEIDDESKMLRNRLSESKDERVRKLDSKLVEGERETRRASIQVREFVAKNLHQVLG
ncbi:MAG TPA: hypothetical protein VGN16_17550 [Acidobacteriaceae bacterium]|jgi:hypothetical protein